MGCERMLSNAENFRRIFQFLRKGEKISLLDDAVLAYQERNKSSNLFTTIDDAVIESTIKLYEDKSSDLLLCYKIISRAQTYNERRTAESYFLGGEKYKDICKKFIASSHYYILEQEEKHPTVRQKRREIKQLLDTVDLRQQELKVPESMFDCLMLVPTREEIEDLNSYYDQIIDRTISHSDFSKKIQRGEVSKRVVIETYQAEKVFSSMLELDLIQFYDAMNWLHSQAIDLFENIGKDFGEKSQRLFTMKFLDKRSSYDIAWNDNIMMHPRSVERFFHDNSWKLECYDTGIKQALSTLFESIEISQTNCQKNLGNYKKVSSYIGHSNDFKNINLDKN